MSGLRREQQVLSPFREISLHLLDIAENSVAAAARTVAITVAEDLDRDRLRIAVRDDGRGMDPQRLARVTDPVAPTGTTGKGGKGIPLLRAATAACNGTLRITSAAGEGTRLEAEFQSSHLDRPPLGDLAGTMLLLVVGRPEVHWKLRYRANDDEFIFDDAPIKRGLGGVPLSQPGVLRFIRESLQEGIGQVQNSLSKDRMK